MNRSEVNPRTTLATLLGLCLAQAAAMADFDPPVWDPNMPRWDTSPWEDRLAANRYRQEGAEVVPWSQEIGLPSPGNAAILYYQAFLLRPQPDDATALQINAVLKGGLPDDVIRTYLGRCRKMIHTAEVASQVPLCTWGIRRFDAGGFAEIDLLGQIRQLTIVLALDARTLGADGRYDAAFARCLTIRRLARHVGRDTLIAYLVALGIDSVACQAMQYVLSCTPPDADLLLNVRGRLAALPDMSQSFRQAAQADLNLMLEYVKNDKTMIEYLREQWAETAESQPAKDDALHLTDEEVLATAKEPSERVLNSVFQVMDSEMPYDQKYAEIDRRMIDASRRPGMLVGVTTQMWNLGVRDQAGYNALKTALEIHLILAQTGQLPEALPAYCPKDPYSGRDFEYEVTDTGFVLRCRAMDISDNKAWQYEFSVRK